MDFGGYLSGYLSMFMVGLTLGMIGGGGAILTVPIMVYLFHVPAVLATSYSLFVVGASSLFGLMRYHRDRLVDYLTAVVFALPSFAGTYATRRVMLPMIPNVIGFQDSLSLSKDQLVIVVFAVVMVAASFSMIRGNKVEAVDSVDGEQSRSRWGLAVVGFLVGAVAGFVGAGGGFLIIPGLVVLNRMAMPLAVGTSLLIVATNSLIGFIGDVLAAVPIDWSFLFKVTVLSMVGVIVGVGLSRQISPNKLKKGFGWFVLANGCYILLRQVLVGGN